METAVALPTTFDADLWHVADWNIEALTRTLDEIGRGCSRRTFALGRRYVLKVAWEGIANIREAQAYFTLGSDLLAVPLAMAANGMWLVSERACCIASEPCTEHCDLFDAPWINESLWDLGEDGIGDLHAENYGFRSDGSLIVVDYECFGDRLEEGCFL